MVRRAFILIKLTAWEHSLNWKLSMRPDQPVAEGEHIARALMKKPEVKPADLIADAYLDLILRQ